MDRKAHAHMDFMSIKNTFKVMPRRRVVDPNEIGTHINDAETKHCRNDISVKFHEYV